MNKTTLTAAETAGAKTTAALASTAIDLARLGLNRIAYIRPDIIDNIPVWSIHAATGDRIGAAQTFDQAWGAVMQNDLAPLRVH